MPPALCEVKVGDDVFVFASKGKHKGLKGTVVHADSDSDDSRGEDDRVKYNRSWTIRLRAHAPRDSRY
eukprot:2337077-Rhodomonas_salina.1